MDPKHRIITILSQSDDVVSGETLSSQLGISRVSIWKHIQGLIQAGTPVVSSPKGYRLVRDPDRLSAWEWGGWQDRVHFFQEIPSTMDEALALARRGCPDFSVVVAQRQTRGRGRMQRTWLSNQGGLYFTVVLRPRIAVMQAGLLNLAAAIDMAALLRAAYQVDARVKWPNDILVGHQKICGILSQMEAEGDQVGYVNIGVGLNVNNVPETEEPSAASLKTLTGRPVPRREILVAFLNAFQQRLFNFDAAAVVEQWRACNLTLGRRVRVATLKAWVEGTAIDLDAQGGLVIRLADGTCQTVIFGDCFHQ